MRFAMLALLCATAVEAEEGGPQTAAYWDKGWGYSQSSVVYQITIKAENLDMTEQKITRYFSENGGSQSGGGMNWANRNPNAKSRTSVFSVPAEKAERLAKKTVTFGDMQGYNVQRYGTGTDPLKEIDERLKLLSQELDGQREALRNLPIARFFLQRQFDRLKSMRANFEQGRARAMINVTLVEDQNPPDWK